jgi:predicted AlkP superfamily pyrophosphatase or phosphodiesterase
MPVGEHPVVPDYSGAAVNNVVPALLGQFDETPAWLPAVAADARQVVLLVLDGLGWDQLQDRAGAAPTLMAMDGGSICTVAPSTTACALTSIATGLSPGQHGVVGYRMVVDDSVLNVLRWATPDGDARRSIPPASIQSSAPFLGERPPVVTRAEFAQSGFTLAHLAETRLTPYRMASTLVTEVRRLLGAGEPFVYAYYEGIDKVSHEYGLGEHFLAELGAADRLVADLADALPPGAVLVVTSDHGQVDVGDNVITPSADLLRHVRLQSGEARFRWLHARSGQAGALLEAATELHGDTAWVASRDQIEKEQWLGELTPAAASRLGDVALVAREPVAYEDPDDSGPYQLIGRHGSLTEAEMLVPLLATRA